MAAKPKPAEPRVAAIDVKALSQALQMILTVIERRNKIVVLTNVLLRFGPSTVTMIGTDLDVELRKQVDLARPGENDSFAICVCAATLADIAKKLSPKKGGEAEAVLAYADGRLTVTVGRSKFVVPTLPAEDFPEISRGDWATQFEMDAGDLAALIDSVRFAASTEEVRYYLNGILIHVRDDKLFGAATDGHRLARFHCDVPDGAAGMPDSIVSNKVVGILDKLLDSGEGSAIDLAFSGSKMSARIGAVELVAKLIDGTFPDYTRVIPTVNDKALWFPPRALAEAVDRIAVICTDKTRAVALELAENVVSVAASSPENGTASEDVECDYSAELLRIGFNSRYLLDVLRQLTSDTAQALFSDPAGPVLWRDSEESRRLYVIMPMKV